MDQEAFIDSFVWELKIGIGFELMLLPKSTPGNPLLLERLFGYIGSAGAVLLTTKRDAELVLTTGSIGNCVPGAVLGLEIWMGCKLGLAAVLGTGGHAKLCSALGS